MKNIYVLKTWLLTMIVALAAGCGRDETAESPFTGSDNSIVAFTLAKDGVTLKGALTPDAVVITAPERLSLSGAKATLMLSENATIEPDPSTVTDWDAAQTFTVTSWNGAKNTYSYSVERQLVSREGDVVLLTQADVEAFVAELDADQLNGTITVGSANGQDTVYSLSSLAGQLKVITGGIIINATYAGEDLSGLSDNVEKTGELIIRSRTVKTLSFPVLRTVRLNIDLNQATAVSSLYFPELLTVDRGLQIVYSDSLKSVAFPKLEQIFEVLVVQGGYFGMNAIETLEFPALKRVGGDIYLTGLPKLKVLDFPELIFAGAISMSNMNSLERLAVDRLETVGGALDISYSDRISELTFPALKTVSGNMNFYLSGLEYLLCPLLERAGSISGMPSGPEVQFPLLKIMDGTLTTYEGEPLSRFPSLEYVNAIDMAYGDYEATFDLRGIKVNAISSHAMGRITLIGDDIFPARFNVGNAFPFIIQQGFKSIGSLNLSNVYAETVDFSWIESVRDELSFSNLPYVETLDFPNLKSAGRVYLNNITSVKTLNMPRLETVTGYVDTWGYMQGGFVYPAGSNIAAIELPLLKSVTGDLSITGLIATRLLKTISFPALQSITGALTITGTNNAAFKDLGGFSALKSAGSVLIANFIELNDFEPLKNVVPSLSSDTWSIGGCAYNPTYRNMADGKYKP
jgi:hypothetical protein